MEGHCWKGGRSSKTPPILVTYCKTRNAGHRILYLSWLHVPPCDTLGEAGLSKLPCSSKSRGALHVLGGSVTSHVVSCPAESVLTALSRGTRAIHLQLQLPPVLRACSPQPCSLPHGACGLGPRLGAALSRLFFADRVLPEPSVPTPQPRSAWSWTRMTRRS